ncbi:MAG: cob(I)yrinic acid a,c-diamide adenosyltransferase [Bacteroidales bacterium]|nr:cob(I)yrinic acid a,c-diamide adenosyltransferase [Bacteroidales bacterium]
MSKIYTKTGDNGTTSLVGGTRVEKDDARVEAYGTVDELGAHVGLLCVRLDQMKAIDADNALFYGRQVKQIQQHLFVIQTLLANEDESLAQKLPHLPADAIDNLEHWIDAMQQKLPPLTAFIIPGGTLAAADCHVARTVCRRAERRVVTLTRNSATDPSIGQYLNRLSDYLFVLARLLVHVEDMEEIVWKG